MATPRFSQQVSDFRTMASGITTRLDDLAEVSIVAADAAVMESFANELDRLKAEQDELKAQLKTKTDELQTKMAEATAKHSSLKQRVKFATPQSHWTAFGIRAKR